MHPSNNDESVKSLLVPSSRGGVDATSRKYRRRRPLIGADGVVRNVFDHPVCASKVASRLLLIAQPPLLWRRGLAAFLPIVPYFTSSTRRGRALRLSLRTSRAQSP